MGLSKTEVNLRRLLAAAHYQQNQAKLLHYVSTLREQVEQLAEERTPDGLSRVSKAKLNEYSEQIESIAAKLAAPMVHSSMQVLPEPFTKTSTSERPSKTEDGSIHPSEGLRRRLVSSSMGERVHDTDKVDESVPIKLDAVAQAHIEKHRRLQEDLTDEMVVLARQLKESSIMMNQSVKNTDRILDSTEKAVEHSLASTGHANTRAMEVFSESSRTTCFTWLVIFVMTCIFIMVVLLIRVT